ncbi:hypothetical protein FQZ97_476770 [compost metagenome]
MFNAWQLVIVGMLLFIAAKVGCSTVTTDRPGDRTKRALEQVLVLTAVAAWIAAAVLLLIDSWITRQYQDATLLALNEAIAAYSKFASELWIDFLIAMLLLSVAAGSVLIPAAMGGRLVRTLATSSKIKFILALLASCTFVQAGASWQLQDFLAKAEHAKVKLHEQQLFEQEELKELKLALVQQIKKATQSQLIEDALADLSAATPAIVPAIQAYDRVHSFLPYEIQRKQFAEPPVTPDVLLADYSRSDVERLLRTYTAQEPASTTTKANAGMTTHNLVEDVTSIVFDETVGDSFKKQILGIDNPLLSELVSVFLDPLVVDGLKTTASELVTRAIQSRWTAQDLRRKASQAAGRIKGLVLARAAPVTDVPHVVQGSIGDPTWEPVRQRLSDELKAGLPNKEGEVQKEAAKEGRQFDAFWEDVGRLYGHGGARSQGPEKMFQAYLLRNEAYAVLWGYGVNHFVPAQYKGELTKMAEQSLTHGQGLDTYFAFLSVIHNPSEDFSKFLNSIGFDQATLRDEKALEKRYLEVFGPLTADGIALYLRMAGKEWKAIHRKFYDQEAVVAFAEEIGPEGFDKLLREKRALEAKKHLHVGYPRPTDSEPGKPPKPPKPPIIHR